MSQPGYQQQEYLRALASQAAGYGQSYYQDQGYPLPQDGRLLQQDSRLLQQDARLLQDSRLLQQDARLLQDSRLLQQDARLLQDSRLLQQDDRRLLTELRNDQRLLSETDRRLLADLREKRILSEVERRVLTELESRGLPALPDVYRNLDRGRDQISRINVHEQKIDFVSTTSRDLSLPIQAGVNVLKVVINVSQEAPVTPYLILKYSMADALSVNILSANMTATEVPEAVAVALTLGNIMATVTPGRSYLLSLIYFVL